MIQADNCKPPTLRSCFSVNGRLLIDGGDLTLALLPTPGHTIDHYALYIPEINTLLAADAAELPYLVRRPSCPACLPQFYSSSANRSAQVTAVSQPCP